MQSSGVISSGNTIEGRWIDQGPSQNTEGLVLLVFLYETD
jgi:hypothetical protein